MSKYTKQETARILAQARKHIASSRTEALRKSNAQVFEKRKAAERQRAGEPQRSPHTPGTPQFDREELIDLIARGLALFLRRQL